LELYNELLLSYTTVIRSGRMFRKLFQYRWKNHSLLEILILWKLIKKLKTVLPGLQRGHIYFQTELDNKGIATGKEFKSIQ